MMSDIPVLDRTLDSKDIFQSRNVFYLWFFNFETHIQSLASFGYVVKRFIVEESTGEKVVIYKFPAVGLLEEVTFKFKSESAREDKMDIQNHFRRLDEVFEDERKLRKAKSVIASLDAAAQEALKQIDVNDLVKLLKG